MPQGLYFETSLKLQKQNFIYLNYSGDEVIEYNAIAITLSELVFDH